MDRKSTLPVSPEQFAAYLDGNLTDGEMARIERLAATDDGMRELLAANDAVDDWLDENGSAEDDVPETLRNGDFPIPDIDDSPLRKFGLWDGGLVGSGVACACVSPVGMLGGMIAACFNESDNVDSPIDDTGFMEGSEDGGGVTE